MASLFEERYKRPPPEFDPADTASIEAIAWEVSRRLRLPQPTMNLARVCEAAWASMRARPRDHGAFRGGTEPLGQAVGRLGVPRDSNVLLYCGGDRAVRLRMRDLVEFDEILWGDNCWAIDQGASWMLTGQHDWPAYFLRLSRLG